MTDRLEGDFTEQDEANLVRLAALTSMALDALAQVSLPTIDRRWPNARPDEARPNRANVQTQKFAPPVPLCLRRSGR